jgi:threonine dehydrogenase-like Zn-dependent dehydrogenase
MLLLQASLPTPFHSLYVANMLPAGKIKNPESMITARISLKNAVEDGFEALRTQKDKHVKILINPDGTLV